MAEARSLTEMADEAEALAELRQAAADVLRRAWSPTRYRALLDGDGPAFDAGLWATVGELGWPDVLVGEADGGGGATAVELCVLAEEVGAAAAPVPLAATAVAGALEGRCPEGTPLPLLGADAVLGADGTLTGTWPVVPFGAVATRFVLLACDDGGEAVLAAVDASSPGVARQALVPLDRGPAAAVTFADVTPDRALARGSEADDRWADLERTSTVATTAELVGVAAAANEAACAYAKERVAFDRPIGSFQAVKHRLVDQRAAIELARALTTRAAGAVRDRHPDAGALSSLAAFWAIDALRRVPEGATQVFGGIAYTWDHDAHGHLRRAACLTAALGPRADHRRRVLAWLAAGRGRP